MAVDPELAEFVAKIYELLRSQQQALVDLGLRMKALEMAMNTNQSFAKLYEETTAIVKTPELTKESEVGIAAIDELIRQLRGKKPQTH